MKNMLTVFFFEWVAIKRSRMKIAFIVTMGLFCFYGIYYGTQEIKKQQKNIAFAEREVQKYKDDAISTMQGDTTNWRYRLTIKPGFARWRQPHLAVLEATPFATLSLGQRDLNPYFHKMTGLSFYMQLYKAELSNPQKLLAGNFDLAFVIIYLFPLLIITLTYNVLSGEKDSGRLGLLSIQYSIKKLILFKVLFHFLLTIAILLTANLVGMWYAGVSFENNLKEVLLWNFVSVAYLAFWFALVFLIVSFNKSSSFNAFAGVVCWLLILIVFPALVNSITLSENHISNTHLANINRRRAFADVSERGSDEQISIYLQRHPELRKDSAIYFSGDKGGKAYAAFVEGIDIESKPIVELYQQSVSERNSRINKIGLFNPAITAQNVFNTLAGTDEKNYHRYQKALDVFHKEVVDFYQHRIFYDIMLTEEDYARKTPELHFVPVHAGMKKHIIGLMFFPLVIFGAAYLVLQRRLTK